MLLLLNNNNSPPSEQSREVTLVTNASINQNAIKIIISLLNLVNTDYNYLSIICRNMKK